MKRILLVDDDCSILRSLGRTLHFMPLSVTGVPISVESFDKPHAALTRANEAGFALVIVDYLMATMSGVDFLKRFAQIHPLTPRVLISGFATVIESIEEVRDIGVMQILPKPWDTEQLFDCVRRAVSAQKAPYPSPYQSAPLYTSH